MYKIDQKRAKKNDFPKENYPHLREPAVSKDGENPRRKSRTNQIPFWVNSGRKNREAQIDNLWD